MEIPAIRSSGLTRRFGRALALNDLSFSVPSGRIVGLLGRSGAGKSTFLRILGGQFRQSSGTVELFGERANGSGLGRLCLIGDTPDFGDLRTRTNICACARRCSPAGTGRRRFGCLSASSCSEKSGSRRSAAACRRRFRSRWALPAARS